jgi:hypothetical protein
MTRRRLFLASGFVALLLAPLIFFVLVLMGPRHRITPDSFKRIQPGMIEMDVEAILGVPAGDHGELRLLAPILPRLEVREKAWCDDEWVLFVSFDEKGIVTGHKHLNWNLHPDLKGPVARLRHRLGL